jgi:hypothetical protein
MSWMTLVLVFLTLIVASSVTAFRPCSQSGLCRRESSIHVPTTPRETALSAATDGSSAPPMPYSDEKMPFYALGINWARKLSGDGILHSNMSDDQLDILLQGMFAALVDGGMHFRGVWLLAASSR